ncbi:MAG: endonuclease domain-containing protein [Ignavibacteriae bacterium]|nr:endonuclease domain-containing protein [Ignavibacteriota bacterium]
MRKKNVKGDETNFLKSSSSATLKKNGVDLKDIIPNYITTDPYTYRSLKYFIKQNRKNQTEAEALLWNRLRNGQLGCKFRRQHAIECYIVDFVCIAKKIIIEADGDYHNDEQQSKFDKIRSDDLSFLGYKILRFPDKEIKENIEAVIQKIKDNL